jgi:hypothetical protein
LILLGGHQWPLTRHLRAASPLPGEGKNSALFSPLSWREGQGDEGAYGQASAGSAAPPFGAAAFPGRTAGLTASPALRHSHYPRGRLVRAFESWLRLGHRGKGKQRQAVAFHRGERTAMFGAGPESGEGLEVFRRAITLIAGKSVPRVEAIEFEHVRVSSYLGNN